jgi:hypothetical protein
MSNAVVTGSADLTSLEAKSSGSAPSKFKNDVKGDLILNGVRVPLHADSADKLVKTVNRFTPQTEITASVAASTVAASTAASVVASSLPKPKYLCLTSPDDMTVDGDGHLLGELGLVTGVTLASTGVTAASTGI